MRLGLMLVGTLLAGCASGVAPMAAAAPEAVVRAAEAGHDAPIGLFPESECSGVVASRRHPGVFWAHRDSSALGGRRGLFAFRLENGRLVDLTPGVRFRRVAVEGASNRDWEDLAIDDAGRLWIGDFGNNGRRRTDLAIYVVDEPDPARDTRVRVRTRLPFRYPGADRPHDAESLFMVDGEAYVVTKTGVPAVYRLPPVPVGQEAVLEHVTDLAPPPGGFPGKPTGADLSADGTRLAVTTNGGRILVYETPPGEARGPARVRDLVSRAPRWSAAYNATGDWEQVEAVAFTGGGHDLLIMSESKRMFFFGATVYERAPDR